MKIESATMYKLDEYTKEFVNNGHYSLYKIKWRDKFILVTHERTYLLENNGQIIDDSYTYEQDDVEDVVFFSDVKNPPSSMDLVIKNQ